MENEIISERLINKITSKAPYREKAFFAIMRQSGLNVKTISQLRIRDLEERKTIPRKINANWMNQNKGNKHPNFIGLEASKYINQYLATRNDNKYTRNSPLFAISDNENKKISPNNVSRKFTNIINDLKEEKDLPQELKLEINKQEIFLKSLTAFYNNRIKKYNKVILEFPHENDEFYRKLYKKKALPFLETEIQTYYKYFSTRKEFRGRLKHAEGVENKFGEMTKTIAIDSEYISSILTLLYYNNGNQETGQNEEMGNNFLKLWKEVRDRQIKNISDCLKKGFSTELELLPNIDIFEELSKTLKHIKKSFNDFERQSNHNKKILKTNL